MSVTSEPLDYQQNVERRITAFWVLVQLGRLSGRPFAPKLSSDWHAQSYSCAIYQQS